MKITNFSCRRNDERLFSFLFSSYLYPPKNHCRSIPDLLNLSATPTVRKFNVRPSSLVPWYSNVIEQIRAQLWNYRA